MEVHEAAGENADPNRPASSLAGAPIEAKPSRIPLQPSSKAAGLVGARPGSRGTTPERQR